MTMFFIIIYLLKLKNFESKEQLLISFRFLHSNYFSASGYREKNVKNVLEWSVHAPGRQLGGAVVA